MSVCLCVCVCVCCVCVCVCARARGLSTFMSTCSSVGNAHIMFSVAAYDSKLSAF
jgi:hypothetical protein